MQHQQYLNKFYAANGYQPNANPLLYLYAQLISQLMNQNMQRNVNQNQNIGNNIQSMGNDNMNLAPQLQQLQGLQGQDLNQLLLNLNYQMMFNAGLEGGINAMMGNNSENNQDSQ